MKKLTLASGLAIFVALAASAQNTNLTFAPGRLAVLRAGDGFIDLAGKQAPVFVDQFDPNSVNANAGGPSLTVAIPTNGSPLFFNGQAATEGFMSRSADRTILTWAGYSAPLNPFGGTPSGLPIDRGFCTIDAFTNYSLVYHGQDWYGGAAGKTNPRGIATDGTNQFWGSGGTYGNEYYFGGEIFQFQSLGSTRAVKIVNNALYTSISGADAGVNGSQYYPAGIYDFVGFDGVTPVPLPNAFAQMNLVIAVQAPYTAINAFDMNPQGTVAYVADTAAGVQKYVKSGGTWNFAYNFSIPQNIPANLNNLAGCYDLVVDWSSSNAVIYATTTEGWGGNVNSNRVVQIVDTNVNATVTTVAQSPSVQIVYRGIDFTPDLRPVITSEPVGYSAVAGGGASFSVGASATYPLSYQWLTNGVVFGGQTSPTLSLSSLALSANGTAYQCVVSDKYGSVTSAPPAILTVTASAVPPSTGAVQNLTNEIGDNITLNANASGTDPKTCRWYTNGVPLTDGNEFSGTSTSSLQINNAQINDATAYSVAVTNSAGGVNNTVATITLVYPLPAIISQPVPTTTLLGSTANFSVTGYGSSLTYQWYTISNSIISQTNFSFVLINSIVTPVTNITTLTNTFIAAVTDSGDKTGSGTSALGFNAAANADTNNYFVVITNAGGSITSQVATLTVVPVQSPSSVSYISSGQIYLQNFDSLPIPSASTYNTANPLAMTVVTNVANGKTANNIYSVGDPYDFAYPIIPIGNVGGLGLAGSMNGWYGWGGVLNKVGASSGDQSTGGQISEGACYATPVVSGSSITNRALGLLSTSSTGPTAFGVKFINNSSTTLSNINLHYLAELWRQQPGSQPLNIGYQVDPAGNNSVLNPTNVTAWFTSLMTVFPVSPDGKLHVLDGTQPSNQISVDAYNLPITNWAPGYALWLVWENTNSAGSSQGIAIDNLNFSATTNQLTATAAPTVTNVTATVLATNGVLNGTINPGGLATTYYFQYGLTTSYGSYSATNFMAPGPFTLAVSAGISGLAAATTYHYQLWASNSAGISTNLGDLTFATPGTPAVTISKASSINQLGATFNGVVYPSNAVTTYYFNWGLTTSYGVSTGPTILTALTGSNNVSLAVSAGMAPNTTYHYQLVALNGVGATVFSADTNFTTSALAAPTVVAGNATQITTTNATLNATNNPNGSATLYWFQYGTTTSYGNTTLTNILAAGVKAVPASFTIAGLTTNTTYHFREIVNNGVGGNITNSDSAFTTLATAPTAVTLAASNINAGSSVFDGAINPGGGTNLYWFQYGPTANYGSLSQTNILLPGMSAVPVASLVGGLSAGNTYHYRIITVNSAGSSFGSDTNFTTLAALGGMSYGNNGLHFSFNYTPGTSFSVYATTNLTLPIGQWSNLGQPTEGPAGQYQFTDPQATNHPQRFYILHQP